MPSGGRRHWTPDWLKRARATFRKDRAQWRPSGPGDFDPAYGAYRQGRPKRPRGLSEPAQRVWRRLVPQLMRQGILCRLDGPALGVLCEVTAGMEAETAAGRVPGMKLMRE